MGDIIVFYIRGDKPMLKVLDVAKFFLSLGEMKHKKLQKLCYYAQAWYLAITGDKLIDTCFEAWIHGPVSPELYERYKRWGGLVIPRIETYKLKADKNIIDYLKKIFEMYKDYSANDMERLAHSESPWIETRKGYAPNEICREEITTDKMKDFYGKILRK